MEIKNKKKPFLIFEDIEKFKKESKVKKKQSTLSISHAQYDKDKDICEYNSGECLLDTTGYIPLSQLLERCGLQAPEPNWQTIDTNGVNKYTDVFDINAESVKVQAEATSIYENKKSELIDKAIKDNQSKFNIKNSNGNANV